MGDSSTPRRRFRGRLFVALHAERDGDDEPLSGITVAVDFAAACLALSGWPAGDVLEFPPDKGAIFRRYLAGGPAPFPIAMQRWCEPLIPRVARDSSVSKWTARAAVRNVIAEYGGVGWRLYQEREQAQKGARPTELTTEASPME